MNPATFRAATVLLATDAATELVFAAGRTKSSNRCLFDKKGLYMHAKGVHRSKTIIVWWIMGKYIRSS